ncbi:reverse transcriptase domain-containing protein, partial [Tanacetum coccineum]
IDIAGPFPKGPGKVKFLIVAIDYFTKWIEAKQVATIIGNQIKKLVWDNIVYRFGLPGEIISDNGKQFQDNPFKDWCEKLCIRQHFASVKHPQTNGLVERANRSLDGRTSSCSMGTLHYDKILQWRHSILINIRNGSRHPSRNRHAHTKDSGSGSRDLVYRNNEASCTEDTGKLGPKWEGPYEVTEALGKGAYKLRDRDGN